MLSRLWRKLRNLDVIDDLQSQLEEPITITKRNLPPSELDFDEIDPEDAITHLAAQRITIGPYAVQRCLLCGEVLDEFNLADVMEHSNGRVHHPFMAGGWYEVSEVGIACIGSAEDIVFESDLEIPDNCCIRRMVSQGGER